MSNHQHHSEHDHEDISHFFTKEFWDERYGEGTVWSGNPNPQLVAHATDLTPGTALDVGSGEGADAIWLASLGWQVTGADLSTVALRGAADRAAEAGEEIAGRLSWQQVDVFSWDPAPDRFDLVSAQFMHLPRPALDALHRRLAAAVTLGGTLLIVGHHPLDHEGPMSRPGSAEMFLTGDQMAETLDPADWEIETFAPARLAPDPDGNVVTIHDAVLRAVRRT